MHFGKRRRVIRVSEIGILTEYAYQLVEFSRVLQKTWGDWTGSIRSVLWLIRSVEIRSVEGLRNPKFSFRGITLPLC